MTLLPIAKLVTLTLMWRLPIATPYEPPLPIFWVGGRLYTTESVHIGVRPAMDWGNGVGLTLQLTLKTPW